MKQPRRRLVWAILLALLLSPAARAEKAPADASARLTKLLKAVETHDYDAFVEDGTPAFKAALTKPMLEGVSNQLAPRLSKGYETTYLGNLNQHGMKVYLWKLVYRDGGDDTLAKLVISGEQSAGFWLQ